jgi:threonine synthase
MSAHALRASRGDAVACDDQQIGAAWRLLAARGFLVEFSSAAVVHGLLALAERGVLTGESTAVMLATAGAYAQPSMEAPSRARYLVDPPDVQALEAVAADGSSGMGARF